jgi:hypothetical protein
LVGKELIILMINRLFGENYELIGSQSTFCSRELKKSSLERKLRDRLKIDSLQR